MKIRKVMQQVENGVLGVTQLLEITLFSRVHNCVTVLHHLWM